MKAYNKNNILIIEFPTRKEMTLTMCRISEFYEGLPGIKGKHFYFDEFIDKYSNKNGDLDYFSFWEGFNLPREVFEDFVKIFDLTKREYRVMTKVLHKTKYIITYVKGDKLTLKHELCHAYYYTDKEYKYNVLDILSTIPKSVIMKYKKGLKGLKYDKSVYLDEINAYLTAFNSKESKEEFNIDKSEIIKFNKELNKLYDTRQKQRRKTK